MLQRIAWLMMLVLGPLMVRGQSFTIRWSTDESQHAVEVEGVPRDVLASLRRTERPGGWWAHVFAVFVEQIVDPTKPPPPRFPLAGRWTAGEDRLRFEPEFPLARGMAYRAVFWPSRLPGPLGGPSVLLDAIGGADFARPVISFFELPPDRSPPDPARWTFGAIPTGGTRDPLHVRFDEPLNPRLALHAITVRRSAQEPDADEAILGAATVEPDASGWRFVPEQKWKSGAYQIVIASAIEDLAGNRSANPRDPTHANDNDAPVPSRPAVVALPFAVK